ncbi:MAG: sigma 54-interacting transcriptional regulator [Labilithrix sp.]|nr:sigma 54-interacting transcriptional regulator [Labilithrix sp.]MBX3221554.1 sigma 54-interacting transcriptional regulator [Labilithrix sp.]
MTSDDPTRSELAGDAPLMTHVLVLWETGSATYFLRPGEQVKLGRHSDCEVVIGLPTVSRRHAQLTGARPHEAPRAGRLATIEDIGGMNGVRVRGQRIPLNQAVPVGIGDVIELGGAIVVLHPPRDAGAPSAGAIARAAAHRPAGDDPMKAVDRLIDVVAGSDLGVLLLGETGVGKTFAAEAIHARSARANGPLRRLDCAALPEALLEAELFGDERGAAQAKAGLLESAAGGTVLLEEIGAMPLATQAKLLTVLETREILRLGSLEPRTLDVRFVAATSRDLLARSAEGAFRLDLYYRLNGICIAIPPLRERTGEIPRFATRFLAEAAMRAGRVAPRLSNEALGVLVHHPFPGNIRELRNAMERAVGLASGGFLGPEHLIFETHTAAPPSLALPPTRRFRPPTEP